ncbi:hypothetical protein DV517_12920 [Streptomyces sp. S816]|uniref:hypothetical protein n=1 Tax=Streptomyces sp. S816 TaxID=2283197 RepID=UPI001134EFBD|nr:hypothetical protein [Streptomyces sp. S816]TGZ16319.1 hypothetical protein DV517_12920 [Streptomyces sp. S816]
MLIKVPIADGVVGMTLASPEFLAGLVEDARADGVAGLVVGAVVSDAGRVLLLRRRPDDSLGGMWEIPSGKGSSTSPSPSSGPDPSS